MQRGLVIDRDAISAICRRRGVERIRIFGSAITDAFDEDRSDVDLLVDFKPSLADAFESYFGLKEDLEALLGRPVDLVMSSAVRNPYFSVGMESAAELLYAA